MYLNSSDDILLIDIYSVEANEQSRTVSVNNKHLDSVFENTEELEFTFVNNVKTEIVTTESSQVSSYSFALPFSSRNYINYSFDLQSYNQGSYGICWACCIWSIGEFINSTTIYNDPWGLIDEIHEDETQGMTEEEKNDHYQNMYLAGRTINQSKTYLQTYYGISTTKHTSVLQFPHAVSFLSQNKPIFMDMPNNDNGGHNMVMCGYGSSSNSYYIRTLDSKNAVYRTMQLVNGTCTIQYSATSGPYTWQRSLTIN